MSFSGDLKKSQEINALRLLHCLTMVAIAVENMTWSGSPGLSDYINGRVFK